MLGDASDKRFRKHPERRMGVEASAKTRDRQASRRAIRHPAPKPPTKQAPRKHPSPKIGVKPTQMALPQAQRRLDAPEGGCCGLTSS